MNVNENLTNETMDFEKAVNERLEEIIGNKYIENKNAVAKLKTIDKAWEKLNNSLFEEITSKTDQIRDEKEAVLYAKSMLKAIQLHDIQKDAFVIDGKIIDAESKVGLSRMSVKILAPAGRKKLVLAEIQSDSYGNFTAALAKSGLKKCGCETHVKIKLTFQVLLPTGRVIYSEDVPMEPWPGRKTQVFLEIQSDDEEVKERLEAARALNDSVENDEQLIEACSENVNEAHTNLKNIKEISREELVTLMKELSVEPPEVSFEYEEEDFESERGEGVEKDWEIEEYPESEPTEVEKEIKLEDIKGIGKVSAKKLRNAGIKDVKAFSETDDEKLKEILGKVDIAKLKRESLSLLKKQEKDTPKEAKE